MEKADGVGMFWEKSVNEKPGVGWGAVRQHIKQLHSQAFQLGSI